MPRAAMPKAAPSQTARPANRVPSSVDWKRVAGYCLLSRALDRLEETKLFPEKRVLYQFSAGGHEMGQVLLGLHLVNAHDAASGYYRSRPLLLTLGLDAADALAGGMGLSGSVSEGRDIGAVYNWPSRNGGPTVLPMAGGVGTQYTTTAGWARAITYYRDELGDASYKNSIAVALGGDASVATNGFWSALTLATTQHLPMLFYIEDNGYGISVPSTFQTPGANIAENLASFHDLRILSGDGCDPSAAVELMGQAVAHVRGGGGPCLLRLTVPRLSGHSGQDSQAYKSPALLESERARDPLLALRKLVTKDKWRQLEEQAELAVARALADVETRPQPNPAMIQRWVFADPGPAMPATAPQVTEPARLNMVAAIRRTLESELRANPKVLVFGEDVGPKGGVHTATQGLQAAFGARRVFDTSLSEEGIIGGAVGLAMAGLRPVAEIQFRKYADPATEQLNDCGTMRWRTANRFAAPIVVRVPGGFFKCGDPWHSVCSEVTWAHQTGWQVVFPSNAEDAVGLLRTAMRSPNPTIFFEHRNLLDNASARRPYPGDEYVLPLGVAATVQAGNDLTIVTWGAMVDRCVNAAAETGASADILDLRTIAPWDEAAVLASVRKTSRCLIVHEDTLTAGFGAEIAAVLAQKCFLDLDAPVQRLAVPDVPIPYNVGLMEAVLPSVQEVAAAIRETIAF